MKPADLIEVLTTTNKLYKDKHGSDMQIFDFNFCDDEYENSIRIEACKSVKYTHDAFGSSKTGKKPLETFIVTFECEDGVIDDRCIRMESEDL